MYSGNSQKNIMFAYACNYDLSIKETKQNKNKNHTRSVKEYNCWKVFNEKLLNNQAKKKHSKCC